MGCGCGGTREEKLARREQRKQEALAKRERRLAQRAEDAERKRLAAQRVPEPELEPVS